MSRVKMHADAVKKLTESAEMSAVLQQMCDRISRDANSTLAERDGYEVSSRTGRYSAPSADRVYTSSAHAIASNARHNTLLRVLSS